MISGGAQYFASGEGLRGLCGKAGLSHPVALSCNEVGGRTIHQRIKTGIFLRPSSSYATVYKTMTAELFENDTWYSNVICDRND